MKTLATLFDDLERKLKEKPKFSFVKNCYLASYSYCCCSLTIYYVIVTNQKFSMSLALLLKRKL